MKMLTSISVLSWDFKIIYVKCLCFIEEAIIIAGNGVGIGLYLGMAEGKGQRGSANSNLS